VQSLGLVHKLPLVMTLAGSIQPKNYEPLLFVSGQLQANLLTTARPKTQYWNALEARAGTINESILLIPGLYGPEKQSLLSAADVFVTTTHVDAST